MFFGAEWFDLERISHLPLHGSNFDFGKIGGMDSVLESQHGFGASTHGLLGLWRDVYCPSLERLAAFL